jgi:uncharacterized protein YjbK
MKQNLEIEYKILISETLYEAFSARYPTKPVSQTNVYFDTVYKALRKRHISCRIRTIGTLSELTFKIPAEEGKTEVNFESIDPATIFNQTEVLLFLDQLGIKTPLSQQGSLTTIRSITPLTYGYLCLDKNHYNGLTDYEIEYEVTTDSKKGLAEFHQLLALFGLTYEKNCDSKIKRCLMTVQQDQPR